MLTMFHFYHKDTRHDSRKHTSVFPKMCINILPLAHMQTEIITISVCLSCTSLRHCVVAGASPRVFVCLTCVGVHFEIQPCWWYIPGSHIIFLLSLFTVNPGWSKMCVFILLDRCSQSGHSAFYFLPGIDWKQKKQQQKKRNTDNGPNGMSSWELVLSWLF